MAWQKITKDNFKNRKICIDLLDNYFLTNDKYNIIIARENESGIVYSDNSKYYGSIKNALNDFCNMYRRTHKDTDENGKEMQAIQSFEEFAKQQEKENQKLKDTIEKLFVDKDKEFINNQYK